jgi:flavin reductase (DIM6/NTAB) family NADH-FMN oxidoreductase RutF
MFRFNTLHLTHLPQTPSHHKSQINYVMLCDKYRKWVRTRSIAFEVIIDIHCRLVTVVTAAATTPDGSRQMRGMTASSFTSVCISPPVVSFTVRLPSRMSNILTHSQHFAINILSSSQIDLAHLFANPSISNAFDPVHRVPYIQDELTGVPVMKGCVGVLLCEKYKLVEVGENEVWMGKVVKVNVGKGRQTLMYHDKVYKTFEGIKLSALKS